MIWDLSDPKQRSRLFKQLTSKVQSRAHKAKLDFGITPEDLARLYDEQNGCCAVSNISFNFIRFEEAHVKHPYAPSVDRILSAKGYLPDNIRIVCTAANFGMGQWGEEVLRRIAEGMMSKGVQDRALGSDLDWYQRQREKVAAAEQLRDGLYGLERQAQQRRVAALKRALSLGPEGLKRAAQKAQITRSS